MLNRSASLAMSTCVLKALPGKLDIIIHSPSIIYVFSLIICNIDTLSDTYCIIDEPSKVTFTLLESVV